LPQRASALKRRQPSSRGTKNQKQPFATMAKGDNPKQAGGTPPKKWFSYKKNKKQYDGFAKEIKAFCKKSENGGLNQQDLAKKGLRKIGFQHQVVRCHSGLHT